MATRILILNSSGHALCGLDGHHGELHAADWVQMQVARYAAAGEDVTVVQWHPVAGGEAVLTDCLAQLHRLAMDTHTRPDGRSELLGLALRPEPAARGTPHAVGGSWRLLHAPAVIHGQRHPLRIPRSRHNPEAGAPRTSEEARTARRLRRSLGRQP